jgi:hypothetical protein
MAYTESPRLTPTAWFDGPQVSSDDSQTVICGPVAGQAALHGLLNKICGLRLVLISVHRPDPSDRRAADPTAAT